MSFAGLRSKIKIIKILEFGGAVDFGFPIQVMNVCRNEFSVIFVKAAMKGERCVDVFEQFQKHSAARLFDSALLAFVKQK